MSENFVLIIAFWKVLTSKPVDIFIRELFCPLDFKRKVEIDPQKITEDNIDKNSFILWLLTFY